MKPSKIFSILDLAKKARANGSIFNPLFVSAPGLGKTEIVQQWAKARNLPAVVMTLSSYDPPDFKGFPSITVVNGRSRLDFATPVMWPDSGEGVIILEELNRASSSIMQCVLSLGDARRGFDGYKLPDGWLVIGCINPENADYDVTTMDPALKDRFEMYNVQYDKKTHVDYMIETKYHQDIINFIDSNSWIYQTPESIGNAPGVKYVSPRTYSKVDAVLKTDVAKEDELLHFETQLGLNVARDFYKFRHNERPVSYSELKTETKSALKRLAKFAEPEHYQGGMIDVTIKDIIISKDIEDELLKKVLKVIPVESGTYLIQELKFVKNDKDLLIRLCKSDGELKKLFSSVINYKE